MGFPLRCGAKICLRQTLVVKEGLITAFFASLKHSIASWLMRALGSHPFTCTEVTITNKQRQPTIFATSDILCHQFEQL